MIRNLKRLLAAPVFEGDEVKTHRALIIELTIRVAIIGFVLVIISILIDGHSPFIAIVIDCIFAGVVLYLRSMLYKGHVQAVGLWLVMLIYTSIVAVIISLGSINLPTTTTLIFFVIIAETLFGIRGLLISAGASSLAVAGLMLAEKAGILPAPDLKANIAHWTTYTVLFFAVGYLILITTRSMEQALERAKAEIKDRMAAEDELRRSEAALNQRVAEIEQLHAELREQALRDPLTGLYNRRYLDVTLQREILRAGREQGALSVIVGDVDLFKEINDSCGHQVGDKFLVEIARLIKSCMRDSDLVCRYGGEEFLLVLPGTPLAAARLRAEQIRQKIAEMRVVHEDKTLQTSISFGVAAYPDHGMSGEEIIIKADKALYLSKASGRNRVTVWAGGIEMPAAW